MSGRVVVKAQSAFDSTTTKYVIMTCPAGTQVVSGGGSVFGGGGGIALIADGDVNFANTGWEVGAEEMNPTSGSWLINAFIICATFS